jgi:hypothetical protein
MNIHPGYTPHRNITSHLQQPSPLAMAPLGPSPFASPLPNRKRTFSTTNISSERPLDILSKSRRGTPIPHGALFSSPAKTLIQEDDVDSIIDLTEYVASLSTQGFIPWRSGFLAIFSIRPMLTCPLQRWG